MNRRNAEVTDYTAFNNTKYMYSYRVFSRPY